MLVEALDNIVWILVISALAGGLGPLIRPRLERGLRHQFLFHFALDLRLLRVIAPLDLCVSFLIRVKLRIEGDHLLLDCSLLTRIGTRR